MSTPLQARLAMRDPHANDPRRPQALRFLIYLYIVATVMIFAAITSASVVARPDAANWAPIQLPTFFLVNTALVVLSSLTLWLAMRAAKRSKPFGVINYTAATFLLGLAFLVGQGLAFGDLVSRGHYLVGGETAASFIHVMAFVIHGAHMVAAMVVMGFQLVRALRFRITAENTLGFELASTFWHALGVLWIYLYVLMNAIFT